MSICTFAVCAIQYRPLLLDSVVYGTHTPTPLSITLVPYLPPLFTISGKIRQVH
jgi:hypothetical protein